MEPQAPPRATPHLTPRNPYQQLSQDSGFLAKIGRSRSILPRNPAEFACTGRLSSACRVPPRTQRPGNRRAGLVRLGARPVTFDLMDELLQDPVPDQKFMAPFGVRAARLRSRLISLLLLTVTLLTAGRSRADEPRQPVPDTPHDSTSTAPRNHSLARYWIVSTEDSPQSFDDSLPHFSARVQCRHADGSAHQSTLESLTQSLQPDAPLVIMVHGSFMDSPSVGPESLRTWKWLKHGAGGKPFDFIYFRWPSYRSPSLMINIDVAVLGRRASRNGFYLAGLIKSLPAAKSIGLIGHSHGTRVISSALHLMAGGQVEDIGCPELSCSNHHIRTVFAASAVDHDWLGHGERFERALCSTEALLNLQNPRDPALIIYPLRRIGSRRALGHTGFTTDDIDQLGSHAAKIQDLNVGSTVGCKHMWPEWVEHPEIAHTAAPWLFFPQAKSSPPTNNDH